MNFLNQLRTIAFESYNKRQDVNMLVMALVISLTAGYVIKSSMFGVYESTKIGFFIVVCCAMWMGMFDSILCICDKRDVLERDKASGLHPAVFVLAYVVYQAFHALLQTLVLFVVTGLVITWPSDAQAIVAPVALEYFITLFLITFASQMLGLAVSAVMTSSEKALTLAPFLLIYELIMSETIFGLPKWLEPLRNTTIVRWGLNSLGTVYNIDALPWRAEQKIQDMLDYAAGQAGQNVSQFGLDPAAIEQAISSYSVDPSFMGVNHNLPEYAATVANLDATWLWLLALSAIGAALAVAGFMHRAKER